ncbi:MAG: EamA family transporter [Deltaproteobacteria bacterium]|nr:EamA family transporter [Deltaproteobacteria bacterium]MBW2072828.1 EamA family transporter [Deltaproteobacteria bacterium]
MAYSSSKGYLCVIAAAVMWASSGTVGKALFAGRVTPLDVVQVRATFSSLLLALFFALRARHLFRIRKKDIAFFVLLGAVVMALVQLTYFTAISKIQVAAAILLQYLAPIMVALYAICFWKERLTITKISSLCLAFAGCYLVVGGYNLHLLQMNRLGILWGVASAVCYATYTLLGERGMHRYSPWTVLFYALFFSAISWHILYPPFYYLRAGFSLNQWTGLLYIAVFGTAIPFGLYFVGINYIRSTRAAITATLEPISAGFIAYAFLGESLQPLQIAGGILVITAIVLLQMGKEQDTLTPELIRSRRHEPPESDGTTT